MVAARTPVCRATHNRMVTPGARTLHRATRSSPGLQSELIDPDEVPRGIAEGAVAHPVVLVCGFLDDVGAGGVQAFEQPVQVVGPQSDRAVDALGDDLPVSVGDSRRSVTGRN